MNDPVRERMLRGQAQAADPQPWRCIDCGDAVSHIRRNDCRCITKGRSMNEKFLLDRPLEQGHWYRVGYEARPEGAIGIWGRETVTIFVEKEMTVGQAFDEARAILAKRKMEARFPLFVPVDMGTKG